MLKWRIMLLVLVTTGVRFPPGEGKPLMDGNGTQDVYEAEEHSNITMKLSSPVITTSSRMYMDLINKEPLRSIYQYDSTYQPEPYMDETLRGRFQCDLQQDEDGQIRCLLRDLKFSDAGQYQSFIKVDGRSTFTNFEVVVKAVTVMQEAQEETLNDTRRKRPGVCGSFSLFGLVLALYRPCINAVNTLGEMQGFAAAGMVHPHVMQGFRVSSSTIFHHFMSCCENHSFCAILKSEASEIIVSLKSFCRKLFHKLWLYSKYFI